MFKLKIIVGRLEKSGPISSSNLLYHSGDKPLLLVYPLLVNKVLSSLPAVFDLKDPNAKLHIKSVEQGTDGNFSIKLAYTKRGICIENELIIPKVIFDNEILNPDQTSLQLAYLLEHIYSVNSVEVPDYLTMLVREKILKKLFLQAEEGLKLIKAETSSAHFENFQKLRVAIRNDVEKLRAVYCFMPDTMLNRNYAVNTLELMSGICERVLNNWGDLSILSLLLKTRKDEWGLFHKTFRHDGIDNAIALFRQFSLHPELLKLYEVILRIEHRDGKLRSQDAHLQHQVYELLQKCSSYYNLLKVLKEYDNENLNETEVTKAVKLCIKTIQNYYVSAARRLFVEDNNSHLISMNPLSLAVFNELENVTDSDLTLLLGDDSSVPIQRELLDVGRKWMDSTHTENTDLSVQLFSKYNALKMVTKGKLPQVFRNALIEYIIQTILENGLVNDFDALAKKSKFDAIKKRKTQFASCTIERLFKAEKFAELVALAEKNDENESFFGSQYIKYEDVKDSCSALFAKAAFLYAKQKVRALSTSHNPKSSYIDIYFDPFRLWASQQDITILDADDEQIRQSSKALSLNDELKTYTLEYGFHHDLIKEILQDITWLFLTKNPKEPRKLKSIEYLLDQLDGELPLLIAASLTDEMKKYFFQMISLITELTKFKFDQPNKHRLYDRMNELNEPYSRLSMLGLRDSVQIQFPELSDGFNKFSTGEISALLMAAESLAMTHQRNILETSLKFAINRIDKAIQELSKKEYAKEDLKSNYINQSKSKKKLDEFKEHRTLLKQFDSIIRNDLISGCKVDQAIQLDNVLVNQTRIDELIEILRKISNKTSKSIAIARVCDQVKNSCALFFNIIEQIFESIAQDRMTSNELEQLLMIWSSIDGLLSELKIHLELEVSEFEVRLLMILIDKCDFSDPSQVNILSIMLSRYKNNANNDQLKNMFGRIFNKTLKIYDQKSSSYIYETTDDSDLSSRQEFEASVAYLDTLYTKFNEVDNYQHFVDELELRKLYPNYVALISKFYVNFFSLCDKVPREINSRASLADDNILLVFNANVVRLAKAYLRFNTTKERIEEVYGLTKPSYRHDYLGIVVKYLLVDDLNFHNFYAELRSSAGTCLKGKLPFHEDDPRFFMLLRATDEQIRQARYAQRLDIRKTMLIQLDENTDVDIFVKLFDEFNKQYDATYPQFTFDLILKEQIWLGPEEAKKQVSKQERQKEEQERTRQFNQFNQMVTKLLKVGRDREAWYLAQLSNFPNFEGEVKTVLIFLNNIKKLIQLLNNPDFIPEIQAIRSLILKFNLAGFKISHQLLFELPAYRALREILQKHLEESNIVKFCQSSSNNASAFLPTADDSYTNFGVYYYLYITLYSNAPLANAISNALIPKQERLVNGMKHHFGLFSTVNLNQYAQCTYYQLYKNVMMKLLIDLTNFCVSLINSNPQSLAVNLSAYINGMNQVLFGTDALNDFLTTSLTVLKKISELLLLLPQHEKYSQTVNMLSKRVEYFQDVSPFIFQQCGYFLGILQQVSSLMKFLPQADEIENHFHYLLFISRSTGFEIPIEHVDNILAELKKVAAIPTYQSLGSILSTLEAYQEHLVSQYFPEKRKLSLTQ